MPAADLTTAQLDAVIADAQDMGEEVDDATARCIAGYWHAGQGSAFYAFASSGHYDRAALLAELSDCIRTSYDSAPAADRLQLDVFGTYLINREA